MRDKTGVSLPFWFSATQISKLAEAARQWFTLLRQWAIWPAQQMDARTCSEPVLDLLAYQRDITRFNSEPLGLYRLRVHYAYINAVDAGSTAGFGRIFNRLGIGYLEQEERMPGIDWDTIDIRLTDSQLSQHQTLLDVLIQLYGRTCRRYRWSIITPQPISIRAHGFGCDYNVDEAAMPSLTVGPRAHGMCNDYTTDTIRI